MQHLVRKDVREHFRGRIGGVKQLVKQDFRIRFISQNTGKWGLHDKINGDSP